MRCESPRSRGSSSSPKCRATRPTTGVSAAVTAHAAAAREQGVELRGMPSPRKHRRRCRRLRIRSRAPTADGPRLRGWPSQATAPSRSADERADLDRPDGAGAPGRLPPDRAAAAGGGPRGRGHRARLRADAGARAAPRARAPRGRRAWRREAHAQARLARVAEPRAVALGARAPLRPRRRPRLERPRDRREGARDPRGRHVRLRVGDAPAQRRLPPRAARDDAGRDPARAPAPLRRRPPRSSPSSRGSRRTTTSRTSSPTAACSSELGLDPGASSSPSARRRTSRSTTARRTGCSRRCSTTSAATRASTRPCSRAPSSSGGSCSGSGCRRWSSPTRRVDGQSLVALVDLVVSAGGTMNREAVALGTPVYTTYGGRLGGVDEALIREAGCGR